MLTNNKMQTILTSDVENAHQPANKKNAMKERLDIRNKYQGISRGDGVIWLVAAWWLDDND